MLLFNICVFQNICEAKSSHIHHQISSSFSSPSSSNSQPTQLTQLTQLAYNRQEGKASKSHFCWSQFLRSSCSKAGCCILHRERKSQNLIGFCPIKVYWKILHYKLWWISTCGMCMCQAKLTKLTFIGFSLFSVTRRSRSDVRQ